MRLDHLLSKRESKGCFTVQLLRGEPVKLEKYVLLATGDLRVASTFYKFLLRKVSFSPRKL